MPTITTKLIQSSRDDLLIYEVGRKTQELNSTYADGVPIVRLTKSLAAVLRHWELLRRNFSLLKSINYWETNNVPFRYGQIAYQKLDPGEPNASNDYGVRFLPDIVKKSIILQLLKVKLHSGNEFDNLKSKIVFPRSNSLEYGTLIQESGMEIRDFEILRDLASFYAHLETKSIAVIATCPTYDDCKKAIEAEVLLWIHDIDKLIRLLKEYPGNSTYQVPVINKRLKKAFECGRQIGEKIEWYLSLEKIKAEVLKTKLEKDFSNNIIRPLIDNLRIGRETDELLRFKLVSKIMTGFLSLIERNINLIVPAICLSADNAKKAQDFLLFLSEVGIDQYNLEEISLISGKKNPAVLLELVTRLEIIYTSKIIGYLASHGLPTRFDRNILFPEI